MRENFRRISDIIGPTQEIPSPDARVSVNRDVKESLRHSRGAFIGQRPSGNRAYVHIHARTRQRMALGFGRDQSLGTSAAALFVRRQHQAGTCRMGEDPANSVVDSFCRVHSQDNLFIADGSPHVTNAGFNPVETIMALAWRTAEHVAKAGNKAISGAYAMNHKITDNQTQFYQDNGFVVIHDFLNETELETWRQFVGEAVAQRGKRKLADGSLVEEDNYYARVFTQRINLWSDHDGMRQLMLDDRLGNMAADLAQVDGIRIWHDQALIKPAWGNPTAWHLDNPYWSFYSRDAISLWVRWTM